MDGANIQSVWLKHNTHLVMMQTALGAPTDFDITIRELEAKTGAGFIVALTGAIMTMPGLPKTSGIKYGCH